MSEAQLIEEAHAGCIDPRLRDSLLRHCQPLSSAAAGRFSTLIHPQDQMLTHSLRHHRDVDASLSQYFAIGLQQHRVATQVLGSTFDLLDPTLRVLDFACGYGRLLRFLCLVIPPERVWASELQSDAMDFVAREFAVRVEPSHADPARFDPGQRFDFIWVASLFSHLPEALFHAWLEKLLSLLTPRGVLCFSVRDPGLLHGPRALPDSGFLFAPESENPALGEDIYGTAYASEGFVREALARAAGGARPCVRLPRALAHEQELYVVASDPARELYVLDDFRRGPWGWVDRRSLTATGRLQLEGWAASLDDGPVECVEVVVGGVCHRCTTGVTRADVGEAMGDGRMANAGWRFHFELGQPTHKLYVEVVARTARGESSLLFAGLVRSFPALA